MKTMNAGLYLQTMNIAMWPWLFERWTNSIHRIHVNPYPMDSVVCFADTYPLDSNLSGRCIALSSLRTTGAWILHLHPGVYTGA